MVIEWLRIPVPIARQDDYLRHDRAIWTEFLAKQLGFAGKEYWRDPDSPEILHLVICWDTLADWHKVPQSGLAATDRAFAAALGEVWPVQLCTRYDVLPPPA
ncbi:MAG: TIGR03792 family protein [Pseudomonadota bacterium]